MLSSETAAFGYAFSLEPAGPRHHYRFREACFILRNPHAKQGSVPGKFCAKTQFGFAVNSGFYSVGVLLGL